MLSFSTEFPVPDEVSADDICDTVREWITGSRFTQFNTEKLLHLGKTEIWDAVDEKEFIESIREDTTDTSTIAISYRKEEEDFEWISTIVFASQPTSNWISVRVECEPKHPRARIPAAKKPVLIKLLLNKFGGAIDGDFKMAPAPVLFAPSEVDLAANCIKGAFNSHLPIVYVSAQFNGHYLVDPNDLAIKLFGMAHVVVEPSRGFSLALMKIVEGKNPYGGTIALYWPEGGGRRVFFAPKGGSQDGELEALVFDEIRKSLINRRPMYRCTLAAVKELRSRRQINALKDAGSKAVEAYVAAFEEENESKAAELAAAEAEITRLKAELRNAESQRNRGSGLLIQLGGEHDFHENEIADIVREALEAYVPRVVENSRKKHILESLAEANPYSTERGKLRDRIKALLRDYQSMDGRTKRDLEEIGFVISDAGKHYKLVYQGDGRYTFILSKTGSDHRGGMNSAADICRMLF